MSMSRRTAIGFVVGSAIIAIGAVSLVMHIGTITVNEDYVVDVGGFTSYTIPAPANTTQSMRVAGDAFDLLLESPGTGLQIPKSSYKDELALDWVHAADGETRIQVQNTGSDALTITGTLVRSSDPIWITYDLMVIISGVVIIGFSMGFTLRRPKGF